MPQTPIKYRGVLLSTLLQLFPVQWMMVLPPTAQTSFEAFPQTPSKNPPGEGAWAHPPSGRTKGASPSSPASTAEAASGEAASGNPVSCEPASASPPASDEVKASSIASGVTSSPPPASDDGIASSGAPASESTSDRIGTSVAASGALESSGATWS